MEESASLGAAHRSIPIPTGASYIRKLLAYSGPGYLIAVGYMDPGNWATDLAGGSAFRFALLSVILASTGFAFLLQYLSVKLGIATGRDLAQACRDTFPRWLTLPLWAMAELMIIACDLAEVIGTAIGLSLLFHIPLLCGVVVTAADTLLVLALQKRSVRYLEMIIVLLIATTAGCLLLEILFSRPELTPLLQGFLPTKALFTNHQLLFIAVGIIGATVMPHNLYLHSAVVQTRAHKQTRSGKREAIRFATIDGAIALSIAFFVNVAILVVAAATFFKGHHQVATINDAYKLLVPLLGVGVAGVVFAVALLASGQNSTITATLAGQVISEGFLHIRITPWVRRLITRSLAIIPAVFAIYLFGDAGLSRLLIVSQVILSLQLPFAALPLILLTARKKTMGVFANKLWLSILGCLLVVLICGLNVWLIATNL